MADQLSREELIERLERAKIGALEIKDGLDQVLKDLDDGIEKLRSLSRKLRGE
jgi:hypothetical protein